MKTVQWKMKTKVGDLYLVASDEGLRGIYWKRQGERMLKSLKEPGSSVKILACAVRELEEYFAGRRKSFETPVDFHGTEFQKKVWRRLLQIPYGSTVSYADIAKSIKSEKAVRAVGAANGRNPLSILVPCHRVIGSNGKLTGYAGGLKAKEKLLALEKGESSK